MSGRFKNRSRSVLLPALILIAAKVFGSATCAGIRDRGGRDDGALRGRSFDFLHLQVSEGDPANGKRLIFHGDQAERIKDSSLGDDLAHLAGRSNGRTANQQQRPAAFLTGDQGRGTEKLECELEQGPWSVGQHESRCC